MEDGTWKGEGKQRNILQRNGAEANHLFPLPQNDRLSVLKKAQPKSVNSFKWKESIGLYANRMDLLMTEMGAFGGLNESEDFL